MTETEQIAERLRHAMPAIVGSLRFWGEWFGQRRDNLHRLVGCGAEDDLLRLTFNEAETLCVWAPKAMVISERAFCIGDADRVRWEWFYYGRAKTEDNGYFMDFRRVATGVSAETNWPRSNLMPVPSCPAVELHSF